jgi:hypothetical protein
MNIHHYFGVHEELSYLWIRKYGSKYHNMCVAEVNLLDNFTADNPVLYRMKNALYELNITYQELFDAFDSFYGVNDRTFFLLFSPEARRFFVMKEYNNEEESRQWLIMKSMEALAKNLHKFISVVPEIFRNTSAGSR